MSFFQPQHLLWGLLAIAIVLVYCLRTRRHRHDVSALLLWERAFLRRSKWRQWQRPVSVLVLLLILAAIVLAAAHPYWIRSWQTARTLIVVVDNSASMNATDVAPSRLAVGRGKLLTLIDGMRRYERMVIISAGGAIRLQSRVSGDPKALRNAAHRIAPTDGPNRMDDALALAQRLAAEQQNPHIYVLSDGCYEGAAGLRVSGGVQLVPCAGPDVSENSGPANVAITQLAARPSVTVPGRYECLLEIANYSNTRREVGVQLRFPDGLVLSEPFLLGPQESMQKLHTFDAGRGGLLQATADVEDHLGIDNVAWLSIAPHPAILLKIETRAKSADPEQPEQRLLTALHSVPLVRVATDEGDAPESAESITLITDRVPAQLPPGPVLAIAPDGDCDFWRHAGTKSGTVLVDGDRADRETMLLRTLTAGVDFGNLVIETLMMADSEVTPDAVIRSAAGDPVLSGWQRPEGRVLLLHLPLDQTDLTLRPAFPILISNALRWLADRKLPSGTRVAAGDLLSLPVEGMEEPRQLRSPSGRVVRLVEGQTVAGPLDEVGVWTVETVPPGGEVAAAGNGGDDGEAHEGEAHDGEAHDGEAHDGESARGTVLRVAACSLLNPTESDLAASPELAGAAFDHQPADDVPTPWSLLLIAAGVLLTIDWLLVQRGTLI